MLLLLLRVTLCVNSVGTCCGITAVALDPVRHEIQLGNKKGGGFRVGGEKERKEKKRILRFIGQKLCPTNIDRVAILAQKYTSTALRRLVDRSIDKLRVNNAHTDSVRPFLIRSFSLFRLPAAANGVSLRNLQSQY